MGTIIEDYAFEFCRAKKQAEKAIESLDDRDFFEAPGPQSNSPAVIVKHIAGNLASRWSDFLTADGEKPERDRDGEFELTTRDTRESLMEGWESAWGVLRRVLEGLRDQDLGRVVVIRGEPHTVHQALVRGLGHTTFHVGQIMYLSRWRRPESPWLSIAPGRSRQHHRPYFA